MPMVRRCFRQKRLSICGVFCVYLFGSVCLCMSINISVLLLIDVVFRRNTTVLVPNNLNLKH